MTRPIRALVVDDSALVRRAMIAVLEAEGIAAVAAADPLVARHRIAAARPDVILLDLEMPREDGLTFLRDVMATDPIPVVICSTHSPRGSHAAFEALREGAVDVVAKPRMADGAFARESATLVADAVRGATRARLRRSAPLQPPKVRPPATVTDTRLARRPVGIAASTGGPEAVLEVLSALPADAPGIVVVQHMPAGFTTSFARYLDEHCTIRVREAADGDAIRDGHALIAPGGRHLVVHRGVGQFTVGVADGPLVSRHRPSADVLFTSLATAAGSLGTGVILTGMGDDGAAGMLALRRAGGATLAQDEASCVVFGMPRAAVECGAAQTVLPLSRLAGAILRAGR